MGSESKYTLSGVFPSSEEWGLPGQTHELPCGCKDLKSEVITEAGAEQFSANTRFGFVLLEEIQRELA